MGQIVAPLLSSFNAGELSPLLDGRVDMAKYGNGCYRLENFIPTVQGPIKRRMGVRFSSEVRDSSTRTWLRKFIFSQSQAFILEFSHLRLRFYSNHAPIIEAQTTITNITNANPAVVTDNAHGYSNGDQVYIGGVFGMPRINGNRFTVANVTANTFELQGIDTTTGYGTYISGGFAARVYTIVTPYTAADLTNADGTFALSFAQTGDVVFIADGAHPIQRLTRLGNTNWTMVNAAIKNGPFIDVDPDQTITVQASAATGGITLSASAGIFTFAMQGTFFLIEQPKVDAYPAWEVNKAVGAGVFRRSDSNVYRSLNAATTGSIKPTHTIGAKFDGDPGVQWEYVHSGYGIVTINVSAPGGATATATVVPGTELPSTVVSGATTRWAPASWRSDVGYPTLITFFRERLTAFRQASGWFSVSADFLNFANRDGAETLPDSAISIDITTSELNDCTFLVPAKKLLVGTIGAEFAIGELSSSDVFGPGNVSASLQTSHGSRQIPPAIVNDSSLFVQKAGRRLRDLRYAFDSDGYQTTDLQVLSTDIARGQIIQIAFQEEPDNVLWCVTADGKLIGFTFNREQDVVGWHRHPLPDGAFAESVESIPSPDGQQDEVWLIYRLTVDGVTRRYVGFIDKDWRADQQDVSACLYSDMGATFSAMNQLGTITVDAAFAGPDTFGNLQSSAGIFLASDVGDWIVIEANTQQRCRFEITAFIDASNVTARQMDDLPPGFLAGDVSSDWAFGRDRILGLDYLEGREVAVLGDGASHPNVTVADGAIQLQRHVRVAQVGLPMIAEVETMRLEAGAENGTAQGKIKRIHKVFLRFFETIGGYCGSGSTLDQILFRSSSSLMNNPPNLFTGDKEVPFPSGYDTSARIIVQQPQPLPMTLIAIMPQLATNDAGGPGG